MTESFERIINMLLAVVLLFLIPLLFFLQREDSLKRIYILTETSYFVDAVRNTGHLTSGMYKEYVEKLAGLGDIYEVELRQTKFSYRKPEEVYLFQEEHIYTEEIIKALEEEGEYLFEQEDFFRVQVIRKSKTLGERFFQSLTGAGDTDIQVEAFYGGSVKYAVQ